MFSGPSSFAGSVDDVMLYILIISGIFFVGIVVAMIIFVTKYSRKKNPKASQIEGNVPLEIAWIVIPTILSLTMFWYSFAEFSKIRKVPKGAMEVDVTGRMWQWSFTYKNGKTSDTLYLPVNRSTKLNLKSLDVIHSLYIPAFRIKEDAVAGRTNYMVLIPEKMGSYDIACAEYCGMNHAFMYTKLNVVSQEEFDKWVNTKTEQAPAQPGAQANPAQQNTRQGTQTGTQKDSSSKPQPPGNSPK
jgi:cytochrome c oxidase subunit 2